MLGDRLKLARKRAGLSLRALAEKLDVSAQAISKYETGQMAPSSSGLVALSKALGVSLDFLMSSQVEALAGIEFRKSSTTSAAERAQAEAAVTDALERWLALDEILEIDSEENDLPPERADVRSLEEVDQVAARLRERWVLGNDPIPSVTGLLEDKGIKIVALEDGKRVYGLTGDVRRPGERASVPVIVVGAYRTVERTRFTLAHELGHRVIGQSIGAVKLEKAMQRFAAAFLVPADHLKREVAGARDTLPPYSEIVRLKHLYGIAASAMLMRLCDIGVISETTKTYAFQTYARTWRTDEPSPLGKECGRLERPSHFERSVYWALADRLISLPRAAEFLRRPVSHIERDLRGPSND